VPPFPVDAPKERVLRALAALGFELRRDQRHLVLGRINADGSVTPLVLPNHPRIKGATLRTALTQAGIDRDAFLDAYSKS
jgi:hypothetical protein